MGWHANGSAWLRYVRALVVRGVYGWKLPTRVAHEPFFAKFCHKKSSFPKHLRGFAPWKA